MTALIGALTANDVHWGLLQSIAWSRMLITYTQTYGVKDGIQYTFDGVHPCALCTAIQQAAADEGTRDHLQARPTPGQLRYTLPVDLAVLVSHPAESSARPKPPSPAGRRADPPPVPPPRGLT